MNQESKMVSRNEIEVPNGWVDQTTELSQRVKDFFVNLSKSPETRRYDHLTELHFSGGHPDNYEALKKGEAEFKSINVLYENGAVTKIHIVVDSGGRDSNFTDIYISNLALKDFLNK